MQSVCLLSGEMVSKIICVKTVDSLRIYLARLVVSCCCRFAYVVLKHDIHFFEYYRAVVLLWVWLICRLRVADCCSYKLDLCLIKSDIQYSQRWSGC